jgi:uncharacterized protein (TIGR02145 family)
MSYVGTYGPYWSSTEHISYYYSAHFMNVDNDAIAMYTGNRDKSRGLQVRCVRDL